MVVQSYHVWVLKRKVKCYNGYFINGYVFHTKKYGLGWKSYNSEAVLGDQLLMSLKLIILGS